MSERENFLTRWSRRKREAAEERPATTAEAPYAAPQLEAEFDEAVRAHVADENRKSDKQGEKDATAAVELPAIDISKLPSIDSITATTDIRPFLAAGVPEELKYAALRRAWVVDPTIRDFVGIAENQWDFTAPDGVPGFGPLLPVDDVCRMVAQVIGGQEEAAPPEVAEVAADAEESTPLAAQKDSGGEVSEEDITSLDVASGRPGGDEGFIVHHDNIDAALQKTDESRDQDQRLERRTHGTALPK